ncbi:unnamed protein product [Pocillopora meandrina]|uniref:BTB domain-containing protein n=1 Tax=Pocillopora meandrina TaxID=46732 RepID=A0AAU9WCT8_9CNID|nr:unnamed protein product [Pocillopora meandrina]
MSVGDENWQTTRPTIRERAKFVFNNDRLSDIKFVVRKTDGESESKQVIPAHKFVLSISSPVFEAMFYGELAETKDFIELPDCEYESLLEFFRFMYSDEANLSGSNIMGVLYLAKKYMVPSLAEKCSEYLLTNLDPSNVFSILPSAQKYEEKDLVERCWKVIDDQTEQAAKSDGFATIQRSLLEAILVKDTLAIEEIDLFKAVDLWATKECERQGLKADGDTKRRILGEKAVKAIRFPTMSLEDFVSVVLLSDILTKAEIVSLTRHISSVSNELSLSLKPEAAIMSLTEDNWQTTRPTIRERTKFVFNNERFSDVNFVVRKMDDERESKHVIPAHKLVLSIGSPVFEAMFYGELPETKHSIELPDCEYESLLELFRYIYSDEVALNGSNVMRVLYLAKKYMVPSLAEECSKYLLKNLDPSNVFSILPSIQKYQEKDLVEQCWKLIDEKTKEALRTDEFATIQRSLLNEVIIRDNLSVDEIDLFKAVDLWATKECERQGIEAHGDTKRRILGEQIVKAIRFPTMKEADFAGAVLDSDILTKHEIISIFKYFNSITKSVEGFSKAKRFGDIKRCCRLGLKSDNPWNYPNRRDCFNFSVDKDVALHAISFFGNENQTYPVTLEVIDNTSKSIFERDTFISDHFHTKSNNFGTSFLNGVSKRHGWAYKNFILTDEEHLFSVYGKKILMQHKSIYSLIFPQLRFSALIILFQKNISLRCPNVGCKTKSFFIDVFSVTLAPALTYGELGVKILS